MSAENTLSSKAEQSARLIAVILSLGALALFVVTGSSQVDPEISASWLVQMLHIAPFPSMEYPVWSWIARSLAHLTPAHFARSLNLFSAVCGAGSVALVYLMLLSGVRSKATAQSNPWIKILAAGAGAGFLMTSIPVWLVSNRAHPASFDLLLLIGSLFLLQRYRITTRPAWLFAFAFAYGVGLAEVATFAIFLPLIACYVFYQSFLMRQLTPRVWAPTLLLGLLGASLFLLAVREYYHLSAATWREATSYWDVLKTFLLDRKRLVLSSVPRHGWLLLFVGTTVPWAVLWLSQRREEANARMLLFYLVLFGILLTILFNGIISPWRVLGTTPLLVTPYLLVAYSLGLLIARFSLINEARVASRTRSLRKRRSFFPVLLVGTLILFVAVGARNLPTANTKSAASAAATLTRATLDLASGRTLWVGDGLMEDLLQLEAFRRGAKFNYVNLHQAEAFTYRRYVSSLFDDPRFQSLALAGISPLISAWLRQDETAVERLAISTRPDIWLIEGLEPVPMGITYLGAAERSDLDPEQIWQRNVDYWNVVEKTLPQLSTNFPTSKLFVERLRLQVAHVANDVGVFMEYTGHPSEALRAYEKALSFEPQNVSAALNLLVLAGDADEPVDTTAASTLLAEELQRSPPRSPMRLAVRYGHLRSRAAVELLSNGAENAVAQKSDPDLEIITRLFEQGESPEANRRLERFLVAHPDSADAWIISALAGFREGRPDAVERSFKQMKLLGQDWPIVSELMGRMRQQQGDISGAREYYALALARRPGDFPLMQRLLDLEMATENWSSVERLLNQILAVAPTNDDANFALAILLRARGRLDLAEAVLKEQLARQRAPRVLVELSNVQRRRGELDAAVQSATEAILRMPQYPRAHEALGRAFLEQGDLERAGQEIKTARDANPELISAIFAQLDWLARKGDTPAATALARETLANSKIISSADEAKLRELAH